MLTLTKVLPALISSGSFTGSFRGTSSYSRRALTASYALNASGGGGSSLRTGSTYPITSSWSRRAVTASYLATISQSLIPAKNNTYSLGNPTNKWKDIYVSTASIYFDNYPLTVNVTNNIPKLNFFSSSLVTVPIGSNTNTSSYAIKSLTASYVSGGGVGSSGTSGNSGSSGTSGNSGSSGTSGANGSSGSSGANGTSGSSGTSATAGSSGNSGSSGSTGTSGSSGQSGSSGSSGVTGTPGSSGTSGAGAAGTQGTSGSSGTSSTAAVQTGSIAKQTILYNVVSGSSNTITGLNLSGNKWGIDIKEEWDAKSIPGDPYYNSCSLLLHFDGNNGSTTFTDNSPSPKTVTSNNGTAISTVQSKFGGASVLFDGTNDYLSIPNNTNFNLSGGSYTIECWIRPTGNYSGYNAIITKRIGVSASSAWQIYLRITTGAFSFYDGTERVSSVTPTANVWSHVAAVYNGSTINLYLNGVSVLSTAIVNTDYDAPIYIGSVPAGNEYFNGYIDELRVTKGIARYTTNFTTSSVAFANNASLTQYATKYVGLIGGLNDSNVDYGVQKLNDSSLKVVKMTQTTSPRVGSGSLSGSVDRVYVNVLDYTKVSVTSSYATNALTASYILGGGANGSSGTSGGSGSSGSSGQSGTSGSSGSGGSSGTSATAGSSGTSGVGSPGTSGSSGGSGTSGSSGATGTSGTSGNSGTSGSSGNSGTSGSSGATGTSGSSGATGASGSSGTSGGGASLSTGSLYPITSSWSRRSLTASYALNASGGGSSLAVGQTFVSNGSQTVYTLSQTAANRDQILVVTNGVVQSRSGSNYTVSGTTLTLSDPVQSGGLIDVRFINAGQGSSGTSGINGTVQTGSIAKQTILYNVVSGSQNTITGLNLSGNKWGIDIKEEWDAVIIAGDQYYNSCSLLLHCDGSNGSTTFTDNSPRTKTVTSNNGAAISTVQSKFGGASALFDGTNDYLSIPNNAEFNFASGTFTIECWFYFLTSVTDKTLLTTYYNSNQSWYIQTYLGKIVVGFSGDGGDITGTTTISANTWYHVAVSGTPGSYKLFINGTQEGSTYTGATSLASSAPLYIGVLIYNSVGYGYFNGYIDEVRITNGIARYTGNFTPQTSAFPNNVGVTQYATKYVGSIGGLNDSNVDYGVQKMSDSSLKVVKMTQTTSPFPSGSLSSSVDRVYVNVLDYNKVNVTSSYATNALTASYASNSAGGVTSGKVFAMTLLFS